MQGRSRHLLQESVQPPSPRWDQPWRKVRRRLRSTSGVDSEGSGRGSRHVTSRAAIGAASAVCRTNRPHHPRCLRFHCVEGLSRNAEVATDTRHIQLVGRLLQNLPPPRGQTGLLSLGHRSLRFGCEPKEESWRCHLCGGTSQIKCGVPDGTRTYLESRIPPVSTSGLDYAHLSGDL